LKERKRKGHWNRSDGTRDFAAYLGQTGLKKIESRTVSAGSKSQIMLTKRSGRVNGGLDLEKKRNEANE